jgi:hypothetical protein
MNATADALDILEDIQALMYSVTMTADSFEAFSLYLEQKKSEFAPACGECAA